MRYVLMVYSDQSAWAELTEEEARKARDESMPRWLACFEAMAKVDPAMEGVELDEAQSARVVRVRDGETIVTDGPFPETKEQIGGIFQTTLPDLDTAIEMAALIPTARTGSIEVRPIVEH